MLELTEQEVETVRPVMERLRPWLPPQQWRATMQMIEGRADDSRWYLQRMTEIDRIIQGMPDTDSEESGTAHLRYFSHPGFIWHVAQKPRPNDGMTVFGYADLADDMCAEYGYISLEEIFITPGINLDYHFDPKPMEQAIKEHKLREHGIS